MFGSPGLSLGLSHGYPNWDERGGPLYGRMADLKVSRTDSFRFQICHA